MRNRPAEQISLRKIYPGNQQGLVEFWLTGTHLGPLRTPKGEIAPTGKSFRVRMMASFALAGPHPQF